MRFEIELNVFQASRDVVLSKYSGIQEYRLAKEQAIGKVYVFGRAAILPKGWDASDSNPAGANIGRIEITHSSGYVDASESDAVQIETYDILVDECRKHLQ